MLSTDHRVASALMTKRYPPTQDYELTSALKEARRAASLQTVELSQLRAVPGSVTARMRALLTRRGLADT
jgi:hypothetical protein